MSSPTVEKKPDFIIEEVSSNQVQKWLEADEIMLVDVRETSEYQQEHIPGALLYPLSMFDADIFPNFGEKLVVVHCAVGKRSAAAVKQLLNVDYTNVVNLEGGLAAWKEAGCPTEIQRHNADGNTELPMLVPLENDQDVTAACVEEFGAHPGQILKIEFMVPLNITNSRLAKALAVDDVIIQELTTCSRNINAELALRLARYLCTTDEFWLRLQINHDLEMARNKLCDMITNQVQPRRDNSGLGVTV